MTAGVVVREAGDGDVAALAELRAAWGGGAAEPGFAGRLADWLASDGERRTTWLALAAGAPAGMASLFEYRRMPWPGRPDARWGYVGNVFVREGLRDRGIGSALLDAVVAAAEARGYARLVLSPDPAAVAFFRRAGFVAADEQLLVRVSSRASRRG